MGKSKKQPPMTDEEREAFEEQQRLLEEETRQKKETILTQFLKDKLMHEENSTQFNKFKLNMQWRDIMKVAKAKELRKDIHMLCQSFDRLMDTKDSVISLLTKELCEAEEMYAKALRSHLHLVDRLLDLHKQRLEAMTTDYCLHLEMVCAEFDIERALVIAHHQSEMMKFDDIMYAMDLDNEQEKKEALLKYESMDVELRNRCIEDRQALRTQMEAKIEDLWQQFRQMLLKYNEINDERKKNYEVLKQRDDKRSQEISVNMRKLIRLQRMISQLQEKLFMNEKIHKEATNATNADDEEDDVFSRQERLRLMRQYNTIKIAVEQIRVDRKDRLIRLTLTTKDVTKRLNEQKEKAVRILKLAELCRKLETEEEKCTPFYVSSLTQEEEDEIAEIMAQPPVIRFTKSMEDCMELENFWKRYNKVLLDKLCINKEMQSLYKENNRLRTMMKRYMDSISVNKDTLRQDNVLVIVNHIPTFK